MSVALGMLAVVIAGLLLLHGCKSGKSDKTTIELPPAHFASALLVAPQQGGVFSPGSGSCHNNGLLSQLLEQTVHTSPSTQGQILHDEKAVVGTHGLARDGNFRPENA